MLLYYLKKSKNKKQEQYFPGHERMRIQIYPELFGQLSVIIAKKGGFMAEPVVTIVTPTYNIIQAGLTDEFNLLVNLLDKQTYPNVEHLIIDKASTDDTLLLLKDYKSKGYINFFSESDMGKYQALNKGIMHAKGKYIAFLSCDDFFHDITAIYDIVNLMEANDGDFSFAPAYAIHPEGFVFLFEPAIYNAFQVMPCSRQAMFFKKSVLEKEGYFDEKFKIMGDFDLIMRLILKRYKPIRFERNYTTYRLSSKTFDYPDRAEAECRAIYIKNFRNIFQLTNPIVDNIVKFSEFPPQLLEKLSLYYPPEDKQLFMQACEQMRQLRVEAVKNSSANNAAANTN